MSQKKSWWKDDARWWNDKSLWERRGHTRKPNMIVRCLYKLFDKIADFGPMFAAFFRFIGRTVLGTWNLAVWLFLCFVNIAILAGILYVSVGHSYDFLIYAGMTGTAAMVFVAVWETVFIYCSIVIDIAYRNGKKPGWASWVGFFMGWAFVEVSNIWAMSENRVGAVVGFFTPILLLVMKKVFQQQFQKEQQQQQLKRNNNSWFKDVVDHFRKLRNNNDNMKDNNQQQQQLANNVETANNNQQHHDSNEDSNNLQQFTDSDNSVATTNNDNVTNDSATYSDNNITNNEATTAHSVVEPTTNNNAIESGNNDNNVVESNDNNIDNDKDVVTNNNDMAEADNNDNATETNNNISGNDNSNADDNNVVKKSAKVVDMAERRKKRNRKELDPETVIAIYLAEGSNAEIGRRFGVSAEAVRKIKNGERHAHITAPYRKQAKAETTGR